MDNRLNPDFIMSNVVNIFNQNSIIKKYKVIYDDLEAHVEQIDEDVSAFIVVSGSNNNECIFFYCYKFNNNYYLQTQGIHKCNNEPSSGRFNILCLLEFCKTFGYDYMVISEDQSQLYFNFINYQPMSISLMKLKLLSNGISWYNSLGFYSENNIYQINQMKKYINQPISIIINNKPNIQNISNYILNITKTNKNDTISYIFKSIGHMIQLNCPNNNCDINFYNILQAIDQFINIIYEISGINYDIKNLTYKINSNNNIKNHNNNIEDDIESYLGGKYISKIKKTKKNKKSKKIVKKNKTKNNKIKNNKIKIIKPKIIN
jgi:hypothetical protein